MLADQYFQTNIENEPAMAAALGAVAGILFSTSAALIAGVSVIGGHAEVLLLHMTSAILAGELAVTTLCRKPVKLPLLKVLRFMVLALPAFIVLELAYGDQLYQMGSLVVSSDAFVGFRILMAATLAGIGLPIAERYLAPSNEPFELATAEERYNRAIQRLAAMDVAIERSQRRGQKDLAEFDARLRAAGVTFDFESVESTRDEKAYATRSH